MDEEIPVVEIPIEDILFLLGEKELEIFKLKKQNILLNDQVGKLVIQLEKLMEDRCPKDKV